MLAGQTTSLDFLEETKTKKSNQPPPATEKKQIFQSVLCIIFVNICTQHDVYVYRISNT